MWEGVRIGKLDENHTHNLFIDDKLLFSQDTIKESQVIKSIFADYSNSLGQLGNPQKSKNIL